MHSYTNSKIKLQVTGGINLDLQLFMINRIQNAGVNELLFTEGREKYQQQDFSKISYQTC